MTEVVSFVNVYKVTLTSPISGMVKGSILISCSFNYHI